MKRIIFIAIALFLGLGINAQIIGIRAGYTMSGLRIDDGFADYLDAIDLQGKLATGFNIGIVAERPIKGKFSGHVELNFVQKGSAYDLYANPNNGGTSGHGETNLNYLELPLMAKFSFGHFYFGLGPYFAYLAGAEQIKYRENDALVAMVGEEAAAQMLDVPSMKYDEFYDMDMDNFNRFDFGGHLSLGGVFPVGTVKVFVEARMSMGFLNWEDDPWFTTNPHTIPSGEEFDFDYKRNLAINFSTGIFFGKPKK